MDQCYVCSENCKVQADAIQCFYCKSIQHYICCDMTKEEANSWSPSNLRFICKTCAFDGESYDVSAALTR